MGDPVDLDDIGNRLEYRQFPGDGQVVTHPATWPRPGVGALIDHRVEPGAQDAGEPAREAVGIGLTTGVDGANSAVGDDVGCGQRIMKGQLQRASDVVARTGCDDGQDCLSAGAQVDPKIDRDVPPRDCQNVQTCGDTNQGPVSGPGRTLVREVDHLMAAGL